MSFRHSWLPRICCVAVVVGSSFARADELPKSDAKTYEQTVLKAINYLQTKGQAPDGSFTSRAGVGVTSLVTAAILKSGRTPTDPVVAKSLKYIESFIQDDGSIAAPDSKYRNYETCLSMMCLTEANRDGRYDKVLKKANAFVKKVQWDDDEGKEKSDFEYGGAGYGGKGRPDLSNTAFLIETLKAAKNEDNQEAIKKALIFVSRCQNLETENNTTPFAAKNPDGGFYYTPAAGGDSQAGKTDEGGLRSYASMTYAGLKSMIYAGVGPDDPRMKAAVTWLQKHYDLTSNPGMGDAGLFYYYHTFAKALDATGKDTFTDKDGKVHDWRAELRAELAKRQREDGSWVNDNSKWLEGDANLVCGYTLLALAYCRPK